MSVLTVIMLSMLMYCSTGKNRTFMFGWCLNNFIIKKIIGLTLTTSLITVLDRKPMLIRITNLLKKLLHCL